MMEQPHIETLVGNPVSFKAEALPLQELKVAITPVQDLHGQDSPYPPGGGKNLAKFADQILDNDRTQNGITFHALSENQVRISGTATGTAYLTNAQTYEQLVAEKHFFKAGRYTVSSNLPHDTNCYVYMTGYETDGTGISGNIVNSVYNGHSVSFTRQNDFYANIQITIQSGSNFSTPVDVWVQVESGSTATAWSPYSNICPISGHTGVNVSRTGKNLFGGLVLGQAIVDAVNNASSSTFGSNTDGNYVTIKAGGAVNGKQIKGTLFKQNTQYTLILRVTRYESGNNKNVNIRPVYTDGTTGGIVVSTTSDTEVKTAVYVTASGKTLDHLETTWGGGTAYLFYEQSGIFEGVLTETDFEAYVGTVYPITWETAAGTVYGGTLDVLAGELTVDRVCVGGSSWSKYNESNGFYAYQIQNVPYPVGSTVGLQFGISSMVNDFNSFSSAAMTKNTIQVPKINQNTIYMALRSDLNPTDEYYSYKIATPVTYQLSAQQISSLLGQNNLWNDINGDNTVSFYTH